MLNKELCKKCWNKTRFGWTEYNEKYWAKGDVECPFKYDDMDGIVEWGWIKITGKPPSNCPYLIEQLLSKED